MYANNKNWRPVSRSFFTNVCIPRVAEVVKNYIKERLVGKEVTVILDEMKNPYGSYINFVIATDGQTSDETELYFWRCMQSDGGTSEQIAAQLRDIITELHDCNISCHSYTTDNCSAMRGTEKCLLSMFGRKIPRIPCSSHIINNILKDFIEKVPFLSELWGKVRNIK